MLTIYTHCSDCGMEVGIPHLCPLSGHPEITTRLHALEAVAQDASKLDENTIGRSDVIRLRDKAHAALALGRTP